MNQAVPHSTVVSRVRTDAAAESVTGIRLAVRSPEPTSSARVWRTTSSMSSGSTTFSAVDSLMLVVGVRYQTDVPNGRPLTLQEIDVFTKTRHECILAGSRAASLLLTVLVNTSVSCTKPSHMALGVAEPRRANACQGVTVGVRL